jgi:hypothetical protein
MTLSKDDQGVTHGAKAKKPEKGKEQGCLQDQRKRWLGCLVDVTHNKCNKTNVVSIAVRGRAEK